MTESGNYRCCEAPSTQWWPARSLMMQLRHLVRREGPVLLGLQVLLRQRRTQLVQENSRDRARLRSGQVLDVESSSRAWTPGLSSAYALAPILPQFSQFSHRDWNLARVANSTTEPTEQLFNEFPSSGRCRAEKRNTKWCQNRLHAPFTPLHGPC